MHVPRLRPRLRGAAVSAYAAMLSELWAQHLAPKGPGAPTVASTFAGCGGSSLGYSAAGFREVLAVEWDAHACECLRLNFPGAPVWQGDVAQLSAAEALRLAGLGEGELDLLDGSPPCQGFSTAGRRQLDDPRNSLFREFVRLLRGLRPRLFVMENVSGMAKGKMLLTFAEAVRELKASGYAVRVRLLNAAGFGVPQSRQRLIFMGARLDLGADPEHPRAEARPPSSREALEGLRPQAGDLEAARQFAHSDWAAVPLGERVADVPSRSPGRAYGVRKLHPDKVARTIVRSDGTMRGAAGMMHWAEPRALCAAEYARLCSFPDEYRWPEGRWGDRIARAGNSVPPLLARAVARAARRLLPAAAPPG